MPPVSEATPMKLYHSGPQMPDCLRIAGPKLTAGSCASAIFSSRPNAALRLQAILPPELDRHERPHQRPPDDDEEFGRQPAQAVEQRGDDRKQDTAELNPRRLAADALDVDYRCHLPVLEEARAFGILARREHQERRAPAADPVLP